MSVAQLQPVIKKTSAQTVAHQLLNMIKSGVWRVGDQLPSEKELVETLGVGRSTVREALQSLAAINVVEASAGHRTVVKSPTPAEVFRADILSVLIGDKMAKELLELREIIEPDCARLAAERATTEDIAAIAALLHEHETQHKAGAPVSRYGAQFHVLVARASHNRVAASFMESIIDILMERGRWADAEAAERQQEIDDHRELLDCIARRDGSRASALMRDHMQHWSSRYEGRVAATGNAGRQSQPPRRARQRKPVQGGAGE